jgi:hypothetical protein
MATQHNLLQGSIEFRILFNLKKYSLFFFGQLTGKLVIIIIKATPTF